jgi:hypothetical protein
MKETSVREEEEDEEMKSHVNRIFQIMVEEGAIELTGLNDDGEPVYRITPECLEIFPEFYSSFTEQINNVATTLWELNIVGMTFNEELDTVVYFDESNLGPLAHYLHELDDDQVELLIALGAPIERRGTLQ